MKRFILVFMLSMLSTKAFALRGIDSGGGDYNLLSEGSQINIWFLDEAKINYCLVAADDFFLDENALSELIQSAMNNWTSYLQSNHMEDLKVIPLRKSPFKNYFAKFNAVKDCAQAQIVFNFGLENSEINSLLKNYLAPTAFAHLGNKGHVWFGSKAYFEKRLKQPERYWENDPKTLEMMLTHELGHVLGLSHIDNTVMDQNINLRPTLYSSEQIALITEALSAPKEQLASLLRHRVTSIDGKNALYRNLGEKLTFKGVLTNEARKLLGLKENQGLTSLELSKDDPLSKTRQGAIGSEIQLTFDRGATTGSSANDSFFLSNSKVYVLNFSPADTNSIFWGKLESGKTKLNVIVEINTSEKVSNDFFQSSQVSFADLFPVVVSTMVDGKKLVLFAGE